MLSLDVSMPHSLDPIAFLTDSGMELKLKSALHHFKSAVSSEWKKTHRRQVQIVYYFFLPKFMYLILKSKL
jgi:hypothetical protein